MYLDLTTIKKHLNIDADFTDDDTYLQSLEKVAIDIIQKHIDCDFSDLIVDNALPDGLIHAVLIFIANMYDNRESIAYTSASEVPQTLNWILDVYQNYSDN